MGCPIVTDRSLIPKAQVAQWKRRKKECKTEDREVRCETVSSIDDREAAPTKFQQCSLLSKICKMIRAVVMVT